MRLKVLKYDKQEARNKFVLFKLLELFGLFLFTFGFETFGRFVYGKVGYLFPGLEATTYIEFWALGSISIMMLILFGFIIYYIVYGLFLFFRWWIKENWRWAKEASEDEDSKLERLSEQKKIEKIKEIEKLEDNRKEFGYCVGDKIVLKKQTKSDYADENEIKKMYGKKVTIKEIFENGNFDVEETEVFEGEDGAHCNKTNVKKVFKIQLKKPKLNKVREEEVRDRKKK